ncbi:cobyric acid synthase [Paenibacillus sp. MMS20-IR301]|uniref:cobyric acid synthase n=1 Tax=Paenibacillus sp. MMS20-IR301 TaxID=2895946 RepID=UPI0028E3A7B4|nr:cobyric acid synthase [Paenibacillus sp. MMS20-IR301]WNS46977.1 cobyric acid synthase [Paenibacillus sp. MMS20-IR301]
MVQGTASDVGKSLVTAAIGRIMMQDGYRTAPFKSQNMALNSYVTEGGLEIGRAQGMQAEAFGITATSDMNPILLKPSGEMSAQIVVHGVPHAALSAREYREKFLPEAKGTVMAALNRLREAYEVVLMEGAGSPAEINLKARDIVNMNLAGWADAPVVLVADIDRGGVFAFIVGTLELLEPHERARVKGFIINKFRGDVSLLQPGLDWLEERTGIPVLGVLPFLPQLRIEAEDSVVLDSASGRQRTDSERELDIAVIRYPRISNFTDFDPLEDEPDTAVRYVASADELGTPDAIILPGTKNTAADLQYLREQGFPEAIGRALGEGCQQLAGICGGYQMLGQKLLDPDAIESAEPGESEGLGYLPLSTTFLPQKTTVRVSGKLADGHPLQLSGEHHGAVSGYEIHMGKTTNLDTASVSGLFSLNGPEGQAVPEGWGTTDGRIWGSYLHGLFHNDEFRRGWLNGLRRSKGLAQLSVTYSAAALREQEFDRLADTVRKHLDMHAVYNIMGLPGREE